MTQKTMTVEQSLESIAMRLDELTGNAMGNSYLKLDVEPIDLTGIETEIGNLNQKVDKLSDAIETLSDNVSSLSTISETLENMLGWYIEFNKTKKTK